MSETGPASDAAPAAPGRGMIALEVLLVFAVLFVHAGWAVPEVNEPHYLGKARHYWEPAWCAGDFFLETADAHQTFYWSVGWLTRAMSLAAVAWFGRIVTWLLLAWAWCRLSRAITPRPLAAVLSAALFVSLVARGNLAGEWIVGGFEAKGLAYVLVLLGLEAILRSRWNCGWLLLGGASALHVLVGGWAVLAAGVAWLFDRRRPSLRSMAGGLAGGLLLALPGLVPAVALTRGVAPEIVREANWIYVFKRLPHHLALHALPADELRWRSICSGLLLLLLLVVFRATRGDRGASAGKEDEAGVDREEVKGADAPPPDFGAGNNGADGAIDRLRNFAGGSILFAVIGLLIGYALAERPYLAAGILRYYWFRLFDFAVPAAAALLLTRWIFASRDARPALSTLLLLGSLAFCGWHLGEVAVRRHFDPVAPADRRMEAADWRDACHWIRDNTPPDALFLTPRLAQTFKWHAMRPEVVNRKDIPQNAEGIVEWWDRINHVHRYPVSKIRRRYAKSLARQGDERVARAAARYGARYVVTVADPPLRFPRPYVNASYAVYRIDPPAGDAPDERAAAEGSP